MKILLSILCLFIAGMASSQSSESADQDQIKGIVDDFFLALNNKDTSAFRQLCHPEILLSRAANNQDGTPEYHTEDVETFLEAMGSAGDNQWKEEISDLQISNDGNLANAWMNYQFYFNGSAGHCGVNSFTLAKTSEGWKIVSITDSMRRDCTNK